MRGNRIPHKHKSRPGWSGFRNRIGAPDQAAAFCASRRLAICRLSFSAFADSVVVIGLRQEGIEAAAMFDRLERDRADAEIIGLAHRIAHQMDADQIGHEPRLGFVVRMADLVADLRILSRQLTTASHETSPIQ